MFLGLGTSQNLQGRGLKNRKKFGAAEVDVEVAGDRRSQIAVALNTDFRSRCHLVEFLWHTIYPSIKLVESVRNGYVFARLGSSPPSKEGVQVNILGR
jgi:hypothetical protein